ncbi:hypothetical protein PybrP1_008374 [[Pythium] brassicae (nom. inval.)]|nr:hypothetical protein PybrP1_008374 [[Pythium] brassicae (nom. inval.)]
MRSDFGLATRDFSGAMTVTGNDVKWMMSKAIWRQWKWCLAHLLNAATKFAFDTEAKATIKNIAMTQLVEDLRRAVKIVREVSTMDSLFESLCQPEGVSKAVRFVDFQAHRSPGLTKLVGRVLNEREALEDYFAARQRKPGHAQTTQFPLAGKHELLHQTLLLLRSNSEAAPRAPIDSPEQALLHSYRARPADREGRTDGSGAIADLCKHAVDSAKRRALGKAIKGMVSIAQSSWRHSPENVRRRVRAMQPQPSPTTCGRFAAHQRKLLHESTPTRVGPRKRSSGGWLNLAWRPPTYSDTGRRKPRKATTSTCRK